MSSLPHLKQNSLRVFFTSTNSLVISVVFADFHSTCASHVHVKDFQMSKGKERQFGQCKTQTADCRLQTRGKTQTKDKII